MVEKLEDGLQQVIPIAAPAGDVQEEVQLGGCRQSDHAFGARAA